MMIYEMNCKCLRKQVNVSDMILSLIVRTSSLRSSFQTGMISHLFLKTFKEQGKEKNVLKMNIHSYLIEKIERGDKKKRILSSNRIKKIKI